MADDEADLLQISIDLIRNLPAEEITWIIEEQEIPCNGSATARVLRVIDSRKCIVGAHPHTCSATDYNSLIHQCCTKPLFGLPRRPKRLRYRRQHNMHIMQLVDSPIDLTRCGIDCGSEFLDVATVETNKLIRACSLCSRRGCPQLFFTCQSCSAVFYCSELCQNIENQQPESHSHLKWCSKMADYMSRGSVLADLPFTFIKETSADDFDSIKLRNFLRRFGFCKQKHWTHQFPSDIGHQMAPQYGSLPCDQTQSEYCDHDSPLEHSGKSVRLCNWSNYYAWRGLSLDHPHAAVLQFPLTVYHIIRPLIDSWAKQQELNTDHDLSDSCQDVYHVHLLGVEQEANMMHLFLDLGALLPDIRLHIRMIGPHISAELNGEVAVKGKVKVSLHRCLYHKLDVAKPNVAFGMNAGLSAYRSWMKTLKKLKNDCTVAYFTDYCEYSCASSDAAVRGLNIGVISPLTLNPFRSPLRKYCEEHLMPWYSNAFVYRIIYDQEN